MVGLTDAVEIAVGDAFACALRATGDVVCWGWNSDGQLGLGYADIVAHPAPAPVGIGGRG